MTIHRRAGQWVSMRAARAIDLDPPRAPDLTSVYDAELDYVWACLRRLGVRPLDLEDAAHDVFVVAHRRWRDYDQTRPVRPWLFGIAYRVALERRRWHLRHGHAQPIGEEPADPRSVEVELQRNEERRRVQRALDVVPLPRRAVLLLHDVDGLTAPEVAGVLQIPINTVYSRLRVGRREFAAALGPRGDQHA